MKQQEYDYSAIFEYSPDQEIAVIFPDLGVATSGVNEKDAIYSAKECLALVLFGLEEDGEKIPEPSNINNINCKKNQKIKLINIKSDKRNENIEINR